MSNSQKKLLVDVEPFEDRIDSLFRELELALKWQRPSILFAIYGSETVQTDAEMALEGQLIDLGQKVFRFRVTQEDADIASRISKINNQAETVFFVNGLSKGDGRSGTSAYASLNQQREYFIENHIRIVFWLTETEAVELANRAPDYWAYRHRVLEFTDSPKSSQADAPCGEPRWKESSAEMNIPNEGKTAPLQYESLPGNLAEADESSAINANLHLTLGILHWRRGDYNQALKYLRQAIETAIAVEDKGFEAECLNAIALVYTDLGNVNEAIEAYKQAIQIAPGQIFPWNNLGKLYSRLDRNEEAVAAFKKASEHKPEDAFSWNGLGNVYLKTGRPDEAIAAYKRAIELAPNLVYSWNGLGNIYASLGQNDEAIRAYQKASELNHHLVDPLIGLGDIHMHQGRSEEAARVYRKVIDLDPRNVPERIRLGDLCLKMGNYDEAVTVFEKITELAPQSGWAYSNLGLALFCLGEQSESVSALKKSLELLTDDKEKAITWNRLGDAYRQLSDNKNAMASYQKAVELDGTCVPGPHSEESAPDLMEPEENSPARDKDSDGAKPQAVQEEQTEWLGGVIPFEEIDFPTTLENPATTAKDTAHLAHSSEDSAEPVVEEPSAGVDAQGDSTPESQFEAQAIETMPEASAGGLSAVLEAEDGAKGELGLEAKSAKEWNAVGHTHLQAGNYDEAIAAYTRAIEAAQEFNWPYIHNLAMAHYHKGEHQGKSTKKAGLVGENQEAPVPQRYEEPPTQPIPGLAEIPVVRSETNLEVGAEDDPGQVYAGHSLKIGSDFKPSEEVELKGDLSGWLRELEDEKTPSAEPIATMDQDDPDEAAPVSVEDGDPLQEADADSLAETARIPARRPIEYNPPEEIAADPQTIEEKEIVSVDAPRNALEWNEYGNIQLKSGACDRAIAAYIKAIEISPTFGWPYSNLGLAYSHKGKYVDAIPLYRKSIELLKSNKEKAISWNRLGDAYRRLNDHDQAVASYQKAVELDSGVSSLLKRMRLSLLGNVRA